LLCEERVEEWSCGRREGWRVELWEEMGRELWEEMGRGAVGREKGNGVSERERGLFNGHELTSLAGVI
jgi:hypothetical protein